MYRAGTVGVVVTAIVCVVGGANTFDKVITLISLYVSYSLKLIQPFFHIHLNIICFSFLLSNIERICSEKYNLHLQYLNTLLVSIFNQKSELDY